MPTPKLVNPRKKLIAELQQRLKRVRKNKPLWAKQVAVAQDVETLEGKESVAAGDYLCRGIHGELWPQQEKRLLATYTASDVVDEEGWRRFDPKPDSAPVEAAQVEHAFRVKAKWGMLTGKPNDYVVRSTTDPTDVWIVDQAIFDASYAEAN